MKVAYLSYIIRCLHLKALISNLVIEILERSKGRDCQQGTELCLTRPNLNCEESKLQSYLSNSSHHV